MVKGSLRLHSGVLVFASLVLIFPISAVATLKNTATNVDLLSKIPCLDTVDGKQQNSLDARSDRCGNDAGVGKSLATYFGHVRGDEAGISGNFDGINLAFQANDAITIQGFAGYPDLTTDSDFDPDRYLYGFDIEINQNKDWILNHYYLGQQRGTSVSGRLIGTSIYYAQPGYAYLTQFEYDLVSNSYAGLSATGAWKVKSDTTLSATVDVRNLPMQNRQKSYLRKTMMDTDGWSWVLPDDRIKQLSSKHTKPVTGLALGIQQVFSNHFQINGSYSVLSTSMLESPGNYPAGNDPINEHFYRFKLSGNDWIMLGDQNSLDLSLKLSDNIRKTIAIFDAKYPLNKFWNFQPKIHTERSRDLVNNSVSLTTSTTLTMSYGAGENPGLEINAGGKWESDQIPNASDESFSYYVRLDYRTSF